MVLKKEQRMAEEDKGTQFRRRGHEIPAEKIQSLEDDLYRSLEGPLSFSSEKLQDSLLGSSR